MTVRLVCFRSTWRLFPRSDHSISCSTRTYTKKKLKQNGASTYAELLNRDPIVRGQYDPRSGRINVLWRRIHSRLCDNYNSSDIYIVRCRLLRVEALREI